MSKQIIYQERQLLQAFFLILLWVITIILLLTSFLLWNQTLFLPAWAKVICYAATVLLFLASLNLICLKVIITQDYLQFGFGIFKKKLLWSEIKKVTIEEKLSRYFNSFGIRTGRDRRIGYLANWGQGIEIQTESRKYYFSTKQPDKILKIIIQQLKNI